MPLRPHPPVIGNSLPASDHILLNNNNNLPVALADPFIHPLAGPLPVPQLQQFGLQLGGPLAATRFNVQSVGLLLVQQFDFQSLTPLLSLAVPQFDLQPVGPFLAQQFNKQVAGPLPAPQFDLQLPAALAGPMLAPQIDAQHPLEHLALPVAASQAALFAASLVALADPAMPPVGHETSHPVPTAPVVVPTIALTTANGSIVIKKIFSDKRTGETFLELNYLGGGTFGDVYEVVDKQGDVSAFKASAIKAKDCMIRQEAIFLQEIKGSDHVVEFLGEVQSEVGRCLRFEMCLSRDFSKLLKKRGRLTVDECRYFGQQLVEGVSYIHSKSIIHRDLKLANVLLGPGMVVKIADMGWAMWRAPDVTGLAGTVAYAAPEVIKGEGHDYPVDVFSLGVIMFEMVAGWRPNITTKTKVNGPLDRHFKTKAFPEIIYAKKFLKRALDLKAKDRASLEELYDHNFLQRGSCPTTLPESVFDVAPRFGNKGDEAVSDGQGSADEEAEPPTKMKAKAERRDKGKAKRAASQSQSDNQGSIDKKGKPLTKKETDKERRDKGKQVKRQKADPKELTDEELDEEARLRSTMRRS
ncbi:Serine/threonine-protein kinase plk1 [Mortierella sp. NVP41]|nr:Serine/threonine-protein kinase plk1 [Mortierella sp. NVP41]